MKKNRTSHIESTFSEMPGIYFWEKDISSLFINTNEEFVKGFSPFKYAQDLIGMNDSDFFDGNSSSSYQAQDKEVIRTRKTMRIFELIQSKTMESPKICITTKIPKFNEERVAIGTVGYCIDLTQSLTPLSQFLFKQEKTSIPNSLQTSYSIGQRASCKIKLSPRESECLFLLLRHKTAKEIAKYLNLSPRTIEKYIINIKEKFNVQSKSELFDKAEEHGFFSVIPEQIFTKEMSIVL